MLNILVVKKETTVLGIKVRSLVKELLSCDSLQVFASNFKTECSAIKTGNNLHTENLYRAKIEGAHTNNARVIISKEHYTKGQQLIFIITK